MYALQNKQRRVVIEGLTIQLFRNTGKIHETWRPVWPKVKANRKSYLADWADMWVRKGEMANGIKNGRMPVTVH